jgi:hypothetical protein
MSNIINSEAYVKQGDKVYKVNGGAGSPIHTFNSVEEMNAANLADGSIACVPSSGGGGMPILNLDTTEITGYGETILSEEDTAKVLAAAKHDVVTVFLTFVDTPIAFLARQWSDGEDIGFTGVYYMYHFVIGCSEGVGVIVLELANN